MISKCADPDCAIPLDYRQGRFFRFHKSHPEGAGPAKPPFCSALLVVRVLLQHLHARMSTQCRGSDQAPLWTVEQSDMFRPVAAA